MQNSEYNEGIYTERNLSRNNQWLAGSAIPNYTETDTESGPLYCILINYNRPTK